MSSDCCGSIAGDQGAEAERAWLEWVDAWARRPADGLICHELRAAFMAGRQSVSTEESDG